MSKSLEVTSAVGVGDKTIYKIGNYHYDKIMNEVEKDYQKIIMFDIQGIPDEYITVDTDFLNKTKSMYIRIDGEYCDEYLEFEREIHEKVYIDTDIYTTYDYDMHNGILILRLYEKINEPPIFRKVGYDDCEVE